MKPPLEGMTVHPWGEDVMAGAFIGCLSWAAKEPRVVQEFMDANPKLVILPARTPIERAIDKAAGVNKEVGTKFADWVAINYWGVEGDEEPEQASEKTTR